MSEKPYLIFLDTETTGLDLDKCYITQLSFITSEKFQFNEYIKIPEDADYSEDAQKLTGIPMVRLKLMGVSERGCAALLHNLMGKKNAIFVAHNAQFDAMFVKRMFERNNKDMPKCHYLDTLTVARDILPYPHTLERLLEYFNIFGQKNSHSAIDDVKALRAVFTAFVCGKIDINKYVDRIGYSKKYGLFGEPLEGVTYFEQ